VASLLGEEHGDVDAKLGGDQLQGGQRGDRRAGFDLRQVAGRKAAVRGELLQSQTLLASEGLETLADVAEARLFHIPCLLLAKILCCRLTVCRQLTSFASSERGWSG
jgi:hypothetical protein